VDIVVFAIIDILCGRFSSVKNYLFIFALQQLFQSKYEGLRTCLGHLFCSQNKAHQTF
jgi:hypothetical protein